ncbi:MAG: hypothetical protein ACD_67C00244G0008 [uncultured bacterium]|nr:MAG: hypothetical protein ACD_67C00244G0008 [uncultured bacterium]
MSTALLFKYVGVYKTKTKTSPKNKTDKTGLEKIIRDQSLRWRMIFFELNTAKNIAEKMKMKMKTNVLKWWV